VAKTRISSTDLAWVFAERLKEFDDCNPYIALAIIPAEDSWIAVTDKKLRDRFPRCAKRVEQLQEQLRKTYVLKSR
jgi:hypothetical protein